MTPDSVDDVTAATLARDIAKRVEETLAYRQPELTLRVRLTPADADPHLLTLIDAHHHGAVAANAGVDVGVIDAGIDILNPVQWRCAGMEREALKRDFGDDLIFHGAVDNQQTLAFGSPEEVRGEVLDNLRILGEGGCGIVYTHFAKGFLDDRGRVRPRVRELLTRLAARPGWFAPVDEILDHLAGDEWRVLGPLGEWRLWWRWRRDVRGDGEG